MIVEIDKQIDWLANLNDCRSFAKQNCEFEKIKKKKKNSKREEIYCL